jgi:mono/diheme cytochrome c family protein
MTLRILYLILICIAFTSCHQSSPKEKTVPLTDFERIAEGKRLVNVLGCNDCHSPKKMTDLGPVPDESLLLSGFPATNAIYTSIEAPMGWLLFSLDGTCAVGPWGTSFASNLTPDATGIGSWTLAQFSTAMRKGKFKGMENGRTLLPPMPWIGYQELNDEEISAIFSYLKSIPPIENSVPAPIPPKI